jgi:hypothetical protein
VQGGHRLLVRSYYYKKGAVERRGYFIFSIHPYASAAGFKSAGAVIAYTAAVMLLLQRSGEAAGAQRRGGTALVRAEGLYMHM